MAWSWSHTQEGIDNAERNLGDKPRAWLEEVYCEWRCRCMDEEPEDDCRKVRALAESLAHSMTEDQLVEFIWSRMKGERTCTNGGHEAFACPYGCHAVPFNREPKAGEYEPRNEIIPDYWD